MCDMTKENKEIYNINKYNESDCMWITSAIIIIIIIYRMTGEVFLQLESLSLLNLSHLSLHCLFMATTHT